jgi:hypothetical protein
MTDTISSDEFYEKSRTATTQRAAAQQTTARTSPPSTGNEEPIADEDRRDPLYGSVDSLAKSYGPVLSDSMNVLADHAGLNASERETILRQHAVVFDDAGIPPDRAVRLHNLLAQKLLEPPDDATVNQWAAEARREARDRYGLEEADRRIEIAREFIKSRPALTELMNTTGLGSHPDFIRALIASPHTLRLKPRAEKQ